MRREHPDVFDVTGPPELCAAPEIVITALSKVVTEKRHRRIQDVVATRSYSVVPVLEDPADPHNGSAVLRSCDAFGIQHVHVIPGPHGFKAARKVAKGAHRWLDVHTHRSAEVCATELKSNGYKIYVAAMEGTTTPEDLRNIEKVAVVFGNERRGVTAMREHADGVYAIPMSGFVESLNLSVAAAVTLYTATAGRRGNLSNEEKKILEARYLMSTVRDAERVVDEYLQQHK